MSDEEPIKFGKTVRGLNALGLVSLPIRVELNWKRHVRNGGEAMPKREMTNALPSSQKYVNLRLRAVDGNSG